MDESVVQSTASSTQSEHSAFKGGMFLVALLGVLWLGLSWMYGWFPFVNESGMQTSELERALEEATATGPSQLTGEELAEALEGSTATENSQLSAEEEAELIQQSSVQ